LNKIIILKTKKKHCKVQLRETVLVPASTIADEGHLAEGQFLLEE
jgi:hypothetical protein